LTLADRIAVMASGMIQQMATPKEIYNRPANLVVAGFVGSPAMNMLEGLLVRCGANWIFERDGSAIDLSRYSFSSAPGEVASVIGVRPEHVAVGVGSPERFSANGKLTIVEPMGGETILWIQFAGRPLAVKVSGDADFSPGDEISFHFDAAQASIFDAISGLRL
jgi:multiple sugar transport system ATP-binding protein